MEATRITRRPGAVKRAAPVSTSEEVTRIVRQPRAPVTEPAARAPVFTTPPVLLPLARFALVALVFGKERAPELLEGLGAREAERAKEHLAHLMELTSAQRQAKVAVEFGMRKRPLRTRCAS